jgi:predicted ABC-type transport system involved in lysophospholipase L1 biosynthesis ATPase subunit
VLLELDHVVKHYRRGGEDVVALDGVDLRVDEGESVALLGRSGSGKSTFLHLAGGLDVPDAGTVRLDGRDLGALSLRERARLRRREVGFVFQFFHLLPSLTVAENVELPLLLDGAGRRARPGRPWRRPRGADGRDGGDGAAEGATAGPAGGVRSPRRRVHEMLDRVGVGHRAAHLPGELSGGEMQRAAIARALVTGPRLVLADEPTGNLDSATAGAVLDLLFGLVADERTALVMVTHDAAAASRAGRVLRLDDGHLTESARPPAAAAAAPAPASTSASAPGSGAAPASAVAPERAGAASSAPSRGPRR